MDEEAQMAAAIKASLADTLKEEEDSGSDLETFSDENHKNEVLRLKIASCYRQSGLRKMKTNDNFLSPINI